MKKVLFGTALVLGLSFLVKPQPAQAGFGGWDACYSVGNGQTQCWVSYGNTDSCDGGELVRVATGTQDSTGALLNATEDDEYCRGGGQQEY